MKTPRVAALHDVAGVGRCSLAVIAPALSAMGSQCCPLPTAVLSSDTGSGSLGGWAAALAAALPAGVHRTLPGSWHGVPDDVLVDAIRSFATPLLAEAS